MKIKTSHILIVLFILFSEASAQNDIAVLKMYEKQMELVTKELKELEKGEGNFTLTLSEKEKILEQENAKLNELRSLYNKLVNDKKKAELTIRVVPYISKDSHESECSQKNSESSTNNVSTKLPAGEKEKIVLSISQPLTLDQLKIGDTLWALKRYQEALDAYLKAQKDGYPPNALLKYKIGRAYEQLNQLDQAVKEYEFVAQNFRDSFWGQEAIWSLTFVQNKKKILQLIPSESLNDNNPEKPQEENLPVQEKSNKPEKTGHISYKKDKDFVTIPCALNTSTK